MFMFTYNKAAISEQDEKHIDKQLHEIRGSLTKVITVIEVAHGMLGLLGTAFKVLRDSKEYFETCRDYGRVFYEACGKFEKNNSELGGYVEPEEPKE